MKRRDAVAGVAVALVGCATTDGSICRPTGWIDRVEAGIAVVAEDGKEEDTYLPVGCFPHEVEPGTRIVEGVVDWEETAAVAAEIAQLLKEMESQSP